MGVDTGREECCSHLVPPARSPCVIETSPSDPGANTRLGGLEFANRIITISL